MDNFSFGNTAGASQSTSKPRLAGNNIYNVTFEGCEIKDVVGVKDPTALYKQLVLRFGNEDGIFEHTVWEPKPEDFVRKDSEFVKNGKAEKIPQPSGVETTLLLFKHAMDVINPTVAKAIDEQKKQLTAPNWDELRLLVVKILDAGKGTKTTIKLLKNKAGEAVFPGFFTGLTKEGKPYIKNNFIGPKVAFSTFEAEKIKKEATAQPTPAAQFGDFTPNTTAPDGLNMDFDIDSL